MRYFKVVDVRSFKHGRVFGHSIRDICARISLRTQYPATSKLALEEVGPGCAPSHKQASRQLHCAKAVLFPARWALKRQTAAVAIFYAPRSLKSAKFNLQRLKSCQCSLSAELKWRILIQASSFVPICCHEDFIICQGHVKTAFCLCRSMS
jgi:hypothetical protein